jgi:hypothetical protein
MPTLLDQTPEEAAHLALDAIARAIHTTEAHR